MDTQTQTPSNATGEVTATPAASKSIIGAKYRGRYRDNKDWLTQLVDGHCKVNLTAVRKTKDADTGVETETTVTLAKTRVDLDKLFDLAAANGVDARKMYGDQVDRKNAPGRLRMTIGNMLRAIAKRRHGLFVPGADGVSVWSEASGDIVSTPKTEHPDGTKIVVTPTPATAAAVAASGVTGTVVDTVITDEVDPEDELTTEEDLDAENEFGDDEEDDADND